MSKPPCSVSSTEARFRTVVEWERAMRNQRPGIRDEIREQAYDKAVDALLEDHTLGCDTQGRPSASVTRGLANQCLRWKIAEDLRARLTPDGAIRPTPRAAQSLEAPAGTDAGRRTAVGDRVRSTAPDVVDTVHYRLQVEELYRRLAASGTLTQAAVVAYEFGGDPRHVAAVHGVGLNAVHQAKSRFARRNQ